MTSPSPPAEGHPIFGSARLSEAELREALVRTAPLLRHRWLFLAACTGLGVLTTRMSDHHPRGWVLDFLPATIATAVLFVILLRAPGTSARKMLKTLGDSDIDYRFDDQGVTIRASGTSSTVSYRVISRFRETERTFLVYTSPGLANIVPKRAFSAADQQAVRALLEAHVQPRGGT
jgi:hypothetical protein